MPKELRCQPATLHGVLDGDRLEVACRNRQCGFLPGERAVRHYFNIHNGALIDTKLFREPETALKSKKEETALCR